MSESDKDAVIAGLRDILHYWLKRVDLQDLSRDELKRFSAACDEATK